MIKGSIVAIVSPMHDDGSLDFDAYRRLIDWHVAEGTNAIVAVGTTGESPTVDQQEHGELIRVAVDAVRGRVPVIAGTGGNSTAEAIELTRHAKAVGADATLQVVPYYNKPTQEGLYRHFRTIAETVDLPMILYNVPGRTVADLANDTTMRLSEVPGIVGLKDATGDAARAADLLRRLPHEFRALQRQRRQRAGPDAAGRARCHLGDRERRAEADVRDVPGRAGRRPRAGAPAERPALAAAPEALRRAESDSRPSGPSPRWVASRVAFVCRSRHCRFRRSTSCWPR